MGSIFLFFTIAFVSVDVGKGVRPLRAAPAANIAAYIAPLAPFAPLLAPVGVLSQSTYIYRVQSSVWRLPNYWPPTPSPPSKSVLPPHQRREGGTHSPGGEGVWVNISEDARHWIGLLKYNPSTGSVVHRPFTDVWICLNVRYWCLNVYDAMTVLVVSVLGWPALTSPARVYRTPGACWILGSIFCPFTGLYNVHTSYVAPDSSNVNP